MYRGITSLNSGSTHSDAAKVNSSAGAGSGSSSASLGIIVADSAGGSSGSIVAAAASNGSGSGFMDGSSVSTGTSSGCSGGISSSAACMQAMAQTFPTLKQYNQGSPLRLAQENWAAAASLVKTSPAWKSWLTSHQAALQGWISVPRERSDMIAGYKHNLFDANGIPVQWSSNMPEPSPRGTAFWGAWVSYVRQNNIIEIQEAARLYRLTSNTAYRDWAIAQLDFYAANYMTWPLQNVNGGLSRMMGTNLDEATTMQYLIDAVRLLEPDLGKMHLKTLHDNLFTPMVNNLLAKNQGYNIAVWLASAIAEVAVEYGDAALLDTALNGTLGLNSMLKTGVTADYLWYEETFGYNNYVVYGMAPLFILADLKGQSGLLEFAKLAAENMLLSPLQFRFNDGYLPFMGDTTGGRTLAITSWVYQSVVRTLPTTIGLFGRGQSWDSLLDPQTTITQQPALPTVNTALFDADRIAVLKNSYWQAFVHYGQITPGHAEYEVPGYELYWQPNSEKSTPVAANQGTVSYGSPYHSQYFIQGLAHNVAMVDGNSQDTKPLSGQVDHFDMNVPSITVSAPNYKNGVAVSRTFSMQGKVFDDATSISLKKSNSKRRLGVVFNTECQLSLNGSTLSSAFQPANAPQGTGFSYWSGVMMVSAPAQWNANLVCNGQNFSFQVTSNLPHNVYRATAPAIPLPNTREAIYLELLGTSANFKIKISPM